MADNFREFVHLLWAHQGHLAHKLSFRFESRNLHLSRDSTRQFEQKLIGYFEGDEDERNGRLEDILFSISNTRFVLSCDTNQSKHIDC